MNSKKIPLLIVILSALLLTVSSTFACTIPSNLSTSTLDATSATLTWDDAPDASSGYQLRYRVVNSGSWLPTVSVFSNSWYVTGLLPETTYEFEVQSNCGSSNFSGFSGVHFFTTLATCPTPANLSVLSVGSDAADLTWIPTPNAFSYSIVYRELGTSSWSLVSNVLDNPFTLTGLVEDTEYEVAIQANCGSGDYSDFTVTPIIFQTLATVMVDVKIFLEGAYDNSTGFMHSALANNFLIPATQIFNQSPWNYMGGEVAAGLSINVVDWVLVELRSAIDRQVIVARKAGLLLTTGRIIDVNGVTNGLLFDNLQGSGDYYIVVRHRNHLDVMSATDVSVVNNELVYDFTTSATQALGNEQLKDVGNDVFVLHSGDCDGNGIINVSDFNGYETDFSIIDSYTAQGDFNLDGSVLISDFNVYRPNASVIGVQEIRY